MAGKEDKRNQSGSLLQTLNIHKYIPVAYIKRVLLSEIGCLMGIFAVISILLFWAAQTNSSGEEDLREAPWNSYNPSGNVGGRYMPGMDRVPAEAVPIFPDHNAPGQMGDPNQMSQGQNGGMPYGQGVANAQPGFGQPPPPPHQDSWMQARPMGMPPGMGFPNQGQPGMQQPGMGQQFPAQQGVPGQMGPPQPMLPNEPGAGVPPPQNMVLRDPNVPVISEQTGPDSENIEPENVNIMPMLEPHMQNMEMELVGPKPQSLLQRIYQRFPAIGRPAYIPIIAKKVAIVSYNRSGSTFIGELFNQNNQSFYWFEPLRVNDLWDQRDPSVRSVQMDVDILRSILHCELNKLPAEVILDTRNTIRSASSANYHQCLTTIEETDTAFKRCKDFVLAGWPEEIDMKIPGSMPENSTEALKAFVYLFMDYSKYLSIDRNTHKVFSSIDNGITPEINNILIGWYNKLYLMQLDQIKTRALAGHLRNFCASMLLQKAQVCIEGLQENCTRMGVRAVKTTRYTINEVSNLLSAVPDVKVVHLIRDPRAILLSKKREQVQQIGGSNWEPIQWNNALSRESTDLCKQLLMDIRTRRVLELHHSYNFLQLLYEDVVMEPKQTIFSIYQYVNVTAPDNVYSWVDDNAHILDGADNKPTGKRNSALHAYAWKYELSSSTINGVDSACSTLYEELGYNKFNMGQQQPQQQQPEYQAPQQIPPAAGNPYMQGPPPAGSVQLYAPMRGP